jgi:hypothetical protein
MLHFRERVPRSWPRRAPPVGRRDASAASSGARKPLGWFFAVRTVSCSPCPGTGRTFPYPLHRLPVATRDRAQPFSPRRPWSSWCGLYGIMQESSDLPGWERKEGLMIRVLAQIVVRQVCAPSGGPLEEPDLPPVPCSNVEQTPSVSRTGPCAKASSPSAEAAEASGLPEPPAQALVVLFTQLAQRRVQAARAQKETHEYGAYHHGSPRTDGVRLRAAINLVASERASRKY